MKPENIYDEGDHRDPVGADAPVARPARVRPRPSATSSIASWAERARHQPPDQVGLFAGAALLALGSVFGYFRLDNATRGYYTGRLQFMTAAAILAIVGARRASLARWIHWL